MSRTDEGDDGAGLCVLVVDDSPIMRKMVLHSLKVAGVEVTRVLQAAHGGEALTLLAAEQPRVVLCDVHMPTMDGVELVRKLAEWPRQVELAAASNEPHRVAFYLYDLASEFHALQHQGKLDPELRFVREDAPEVSRARLALVRATQVVIATGLGILGVTPMDEMR